MMKRGLDRVGIFFRNCLLDLLDGGSDGRNNGTVSVSFFDCLTFSFECGWVIGHSESS